MYLLFSHHIVWRNYFFPNTDKNLFSSLIYVRHWTSDCLEEEKIGLSFLKKNRAHNTTLYIEMPNANY